MHAQRKTLATGKHLIADKPYPLRQSAISISFARDAVVSEATLFVIRMPLQDLMEKIRLRDAAIAALPDRFVAAAKGFNRELFPKERLMFTETPPVKRAPKKKVEKKFRRIGTK